MYRGERTDRNAFWVSLVHVRTWKPRLRRGGRLGDPPPGVSLWVRSSGGREFLVLLRWLWWLVVGAVAEHGEQDVAAAAGEADQRRVVFLPFGAFLVVVGAADGVGQGSERGEEEGSLELAIACSRRMFALDRGARFVRNWGDAGVGSQAGRAGEAGCVADLEQDAGGGPDPDAGHRSQDPGKRVRIKQLLHLGG